MMIRQCKKIHPFVPLAILYCLLASARASVTYNNSPWLFFSIAVVCFVYFFVRSEIKSTPLSLFASFLLLTSSIYTMHGGSSAGAIAMAMNVLLPVVLLNIKNEVRINLLHTISRWFAILLVFSLVAWILHFLISLPHIVEVREAFFARNGLTVNNYILFQESLFNEYYGDDFLRFQGCFLEPGHLGTIVAFFLIANCFDFRRKENWAFLITILISLSASAYLLVALGFFFYRLSEKNSQKLLVTGLLTIVVVIFFMFYNGGDNLINNLIFGKLMRESGAVEGRVSFEVLAMYKSMWMTGKDILFGKGSFIEVEASAGLILYFVMHGIVGCIFLFLSYFFIYRSCKTRYGMFVFILYVISFLQRTYPYWDAFLDPFILGLPFFLQKQYEKNKTTLGNTIIINNKTE